MPVTADNEQDNRFKDVFRGENENDWAPDPEDFREEPPRQPGPLAHFPSTRHAIPAVLAFIMFYIATVVFQGSPEGDLLWLSGDALINRHEFWRIATSLFAHADPGHLLANALIFLVFGWMLKAYFGAIAFPVLSFTAGMIANLATVLIYRPEVRLIGASGMAYGMVGLWLVFYIRYESDHSVPVRIFRAIGFSLVMMFPSAFDPHVSYLAHALGFVAGLLLGAVSLSFVSARNPE